MTADLTAHTESERRSAETARRLVLEQHLGLRKLLMMGLAHANASGDEQEPGHEPLRALVGEIHAAFVQHLVDEEALIFPILEDDLPVGPHRAELIREEHARQRAELEALCAWPEDGSDRALGLRFQELAASLIADIVHEEREVLTPEVIRDDLIVIDQCGG